MDVNLRGDEDMRWILESLNVLITASIGVIRMFGTSFASQETCMEVGSKGTTVFSEMFGGIKIEVHRKFNEN